jgi:hypothetical protein
MSFPDFAAAVSGLRLLLQPGLLRAMFDVGYFPAEPQYR